MKKAKLSLAWQILIGLVLGIAIGALLNHFSAEKAWWISNVLQPAGDIFIRLIKMIVIPIVISSLIVGIAGVGDAKLSSCGLANVKKSVIISDARSNSSRARPKYFFGLSSDVSLNNWRKPRVT